LENRKARCNFGHYRPARYFDLYPHCVFGLERRHRFCRRIKSKASRIKERFAATKAYGDVCPALNFSEPRGRRDGAKLDFNNAWLRTNFEKARRKKSPVKTLNVIPIVASGEQQRARLVEE